MNALPLVSLRVSKIIRATPERLFRAWTDPKQLAQWWHLQGEGWSFLDATVDLREGGGYRLGMTDPDGKAHVAVGEYHEVLRPTRLVFSWHWASATGPGPETLVIVELNQTMNDATEVVISHSRISDERTRIGFQAGWSQLLSVLIDYLGRQP